MTRVSATRQRSDARSNRTRILAVAQTLLVNNPDASMEDVAAAAGVVRRTVYAHFSSRDALIQGIAVEAADAIAEVMSPGGVDSSTQPDDERSRAESNADLTETETDDPREAMARRSLALTDVGERYRLLIRVARNHLGEDGIHGLLAPMRNHASEQIAAGQQSGHFADHLPPEVLAVTIESVAISLLEAANDGTVTDTGLAIAQSALALLGVPPAVSTGLVHRIRAEASTPSP